MQNLVTKLGGDALDGALHDRIIVREQDAA
jgi:hypothetical protein